MPNKPALARVFDKGPNFDHITADDLSLKLATTPEEIAAAQKLRYDVFYKEMGAHPINDMAELERDYDQYDLYCDHLLVIDKDRIVGTYRVLMRDTAEANGITLYAETEYDFSKLKAKGGRIMEVSRSCVLPSHRSRAAINLLWKGMAAYVVAYNVDYMIGTPSFPGIDVQEHHEALGYLQAYHLAPNEICPRVLEDHYIPMPVIPQDQLNQRKLFMQLPPLLKGYLRLGAVVADGMYIDHQFNCIDTAIIMPTKSIDKRYFDKYMPPNA